MRGPVEGDGHAELRRDLLAGLERMRGSSRRVRRVEPYRRRGWTGARVAREAERIAAELAARGVEPGDRVALRVSDGPLWQAAFFGVLRAGAVAVPLDDAFDERAIRRAVAELGVAATCADDELARADPEVPELRLSMRAPPLPARPTPPLPADDWRRPAEIVLTSGTSGAARAVTVGHGNLRSVVDALERGIRPYRIAIRLAPRVRIACALPLSHLYGQAMYVFVPPLLDADAILIAPMPAPDLARALRREGAFALATVPRTLSLLASWLRSRGEARWGAAGFARRLARVEGRPWWARAALLARLRLELGPRLVAIVSGGAALDPATAAFWRALGYVVVQGYGMTETAPLVTLDHPFDSRPGSLGRPLPGVELRIGADREIHVRGPNVAGAVDSEGWLHTGDLGRVDAEGRLWFLGRKEDRIVTAAGLNVETADVADRLRARPEVADALVLERPWGEPGAVAAVIVPRPGADPARAIEAANAELPDAARIRAWRLWPETDFPRTRTGKPRAAEIREWLAGAGATPPDSRQGRPEEDAPERGSGVAAVARIVSGIGGIDESALAPETRLGDALGSLDRVELVTRIELAYGVPLPAEAAAPERRLGELAAALAAPPAVPDGGPDGVVARPIPESRWRAWAPVRALRFAFAQGALRPVWRTLVDLDAAGLERLADLRPPFLVAANHLSVLDPGAVLFALTPRRSARIATTAMGEHFERSRAGWLQYRLAVAGLNLVPLLQTGDWRPTLRIAGEVADRGGCPLVFPEGERSVDGALLPFRSGIGILARDLHLPVVPCAAAGLLAVLPKGARWPRGFWRRRAPVAIRFGEPIPAPRAGADPAGFAATVRERVAALLPDARAAAGRF